MTEDSPRRRLLDAAVTLLAQEPGAEPTTRALCALAGVTAPSLYHHFGDKDGLLAAVLTEAFEDYLARKRAIAQTGDLLADFAAGWRMHLRFGLDHPLLYTAVFASSRPRGAAVAARAAEELQVDLVAMEQAGLLRVPVDAAVDLTLAASVGCVLQLLRTGRDETGTLAVHAREALVGRLCGEAYAAVEPRHAAEPAQQTAQRVVRQPGAPVAARQLLAELDDAAEVLGAEEAALLGAWLTRLAGEPA